MGSRYNVTIRARKLSDAAFATVRAGVQLELDRVDHSMSFFRPDSELSKLNSCSEGHPFQSSKEMFQVIRAAQEVSSVSRGAFDVTAGSLVDAWGFGPAEARGVPDDAKVSRAMKDMSFRTLILDERALTITKTHSATHCDLGGIASGYAADRVAQMLHVHGITNYVIEVSGEVRARGFNASGQHWRVGIEQPDAEPGTLRWQVPLDNAALATSGDYRKYFVREGRRYSHEIDPHTGAPVNQKLCSVTVIDGQGVRADALATALIVLGVERGRRLAEQLNLAALFITRESDGSYSDLWSSAFERTGATLIRS